MSSSTTNYSAPQVLHLEDRGDCAIEYIDLFDEGRYGADKLFFRGRFSTLEEVAYQIGVLLKMGSPLKRTFDATSTTEIATGVSLPNILCMNRWTSDTYRDAIATKDLRDCWHHKAHFPINILLRIKFYSDFAYVHIGDKWGTLFDEDGNVKESNSQYLPTLNGKELIDTYSLSTEEDFSVICHSNISLNDSKLILAGLFDIALDDKVENGDASDLSYGVTANGLAYGTLSSIDDIIGIDNSTIKDISNVVIVSTILDEAWTGSLLTSVELSIPDVTSTKGTFKDCVYLIDVSFTSELSSLEYAENMFDGCTALTNASLVNIANALPTVTSGTIGFAGVSMQKRTEAMFNEKGWTVVDAYVTEYDGPNKILFYDTSQLEYGENTFLIYGSSDSE